MPTIRNHSRVMMLGGYHFNHRYEISSYGSSATPLGIGECSPFSFYCGGNGASVGRGRVCQYGTHE